MAIPQTSRDEIAPREKLCPVFEMMPSRPQSYSCVPAILLYLVIAIAMTVHGLHSAKIRAKIVEGDSEAYLSIASSFAAGDFSMSYVPHWPHRQPLYPAMLSIPLKLCGNNLADLVSVNIVFGLLLVVAVYFGVLKILGDPLVAGLIALCVPLNRLLMDFIPRHLVTEPLFVLLVFLGILGFLAYLRDGRSAPLFTASAACGLAYLTRPNGLFIMAAMLGTLGCRDLLLYAKNIRTGAAKISGELPRLLFNYALASVIFIVLSAPSWVPRWRMLGSPISHGYVSNYLFVDSYEQGHDQSHAPYQFKDYVATHNAFHVIKRLTSGFVQIYVRVPLWCEEWAILYVLGVVGFCVSFWKGPPAFRWLALWMFVELLPLVWTNLSNPTGRVPYAAMLPFLFIFAAIGTDWIRSKFFPTVPVHG